MFNNPEQLYAALPNYDSNGANITSTIWSNGNRIEFDQKLKTWIHSIKMQSKFNVHLLKHKTENYFARKQVLPIPISPTCILIPFKVRKPIGANDGAYRYIALDSIEEVIDNHCSLMRSAIVLKNSTDIIPVTSPLIATKQQVAIAQVVREQYFDFLSASIL